MENSISLSILIPLVPFGMTIFIFTLLRSFNRTINRLTKPVSLLLLLSILSSTFLCLYFFLNHIEGQILLSNYFSVFKNLNLEIHLNDTSERLIIIIGFLISLLIVYSVTKLPRKTGYVLYIVNLGFFASIMISGLLLIDIPF